QFELGWLHHRQVRWVLPFENTAGINADLMICLGKVSTVTHQTARRGELAEFVYRGNRILCGERYERFALRVEERIGCDEKRTSRLSGKRGKSCAELVCSGDFHNIGLQLQSTRRRLDFAYDSLGIRVAGVHKYADYFRLWHKFMQKFKLLGLHSDGEQMYSGGISTWMIEAWDKAELDRVAGNIGIVDVAALAASAGRPPTRGDHRCVMLNQIGSERREPVKVTFGPAIFDCC